MGKLFSVSSPFDELSRTCDPSWFISEKCSVCRFALFQPRQTKKMGFTWQSAVSDTFLLLTVGLRYFSDSGGERGGSRVLASLRKCSCQECFFRPSMWTLNSLHRSEPDRPDSETFLDGVKFNLVTWDRCKLWALQTLHFVSKGKQFSKTSSKYFMTPTSFLVATSLNFS